MVSYRFYVGTQRSLASEQGYVYQEYKMLFQEAIEFSAKRVVLEKDKFVADAKTAFYRGILMVNGPITWLALHYRGPVLTRIRLVLEMLHDVRGYSSMLLIKHFPFIPLFLCLLPRSLNRLLARLHVGY
jgi:hypothetical protein